MTEPAHRRDPRRVAQVVVIAAVAIYALLFVVFNAHRVKVDFVFATTRVSLIFVILLALAAGLVLGVLGEKLRRHRQRRR